MTGFRACVCSGLALVSLMCYVWPLYMYVLTQLILLQCPSTIGEEKQYNPFLRTHIHEVMSAVGIDVLPEQNANLQSVSVLVALRKRKDNFK